MSPMAGGAGTNPLPRPDAKSTIPLPGPDRGRLSRREFVAGAVKLGAAGACGTLLGACHRARRAAPARLAGRVQILVGFEGGNDAPQRQVQQALAQAYIAAHPQVGIDILRAPSAAAAATQLTTLLARGAPPDIVLGVGLGDMAGLVDQSVWMDLRRYFSRDRVSTGAFQAQAVTAAALKGYYGGTKAIPGIPLGIHDHALAYNAELVQKTGLPAPPASWTGGSWTLTGAFLDLARALTVDKSGKHAGQPGFDSSRVVQYGVARIPPEMVFLAFGGQIYDPAHRQARLDQPPAIAGAQFYGDLVHRHGVSPTAAQLMELGGVKTDDGGLAAWRAGKVAMIDLCSCEIATQFGTKVPFSWRAGALPAGPARPCGRLEVLQGAIVAASTHRDLAWEVLKAFAVDPTQERQLAYGGFNAIPALNSNRAAFAAGTKPATGVDPAVWLAGLDSSPADADAWIPAFTDVHALLTAAFDQVAAGAPAATVMPQVQQQAQAKINAWFKSHRLP